MCGTIGALVSSLTVENLLIEEFEKGFLKYEIMSLCMGKDCEMAYFSADYGFLYFENAIKVPLDFKSGAEKRYVCYCKNITVDELKKMVKNNGIRRVKEVFMFKTPVIIEECKTTNPFGYCCFPDIKRMIEDILNGAEV